MLWQAKRILALAEQGTPSFLEVFDRVRRGRRSSYLLGSLVKELPRLFSSGSGHGSHDGHDGSAAGSAASAARAEGPACESCSPVASPEFHASSMRGVATGTAGSAPAGGGHSGGGGHAGGFESYQVERWMRPTLAQRSAWSRSLKPRPRWPDGRPWARSLARSLA